LAARESGKLPGTDVREGVRTLPMVFALREPGPEAARLRELLSGPIHDDEAVMEALTLLRASPGMEKAKQFLADYKAAGFKDSYTAYGALAYDAANAIISTLPAALGTASSVDDSVRRKVVDAVGKVNFKGASGTVAFDSFGDTVTKSLTRYKVQNGAFTPIKTGEFKG